MRPLSRGFTCFSLLAFAALASTPEKAAAQASLSAYQGAWVDKDFSCEEMFIEGRNGYSFRRPVNIFVPAFVISGRRLRTALAVCGIRSIRTDGMHDVFNLSCTNGISTEAVSARLSVASPGYLKRHMNEHDKVGTVYMRCSR